MIPVLQQIFAPAGAAMNLTENGGVDSGRFDLGMLESGTEIDQGDANPMGGFAAVFVAQETAKTEFTAIEAVVLAETGDISAEALIDAGAMFALRLPITPDTMPVPQDAALAGPIVPEPMIDAAAAPATVALIGPAPAVFGTAEETIPKDKARGAAIVVPQMAGEPSHSLPALPISALGGDSVQTIPSPPTLNGEGALIADLPSAPISTPQIPADAGDQKVVVTPKSLAQMPQILPILSSAPTASLAEAMFQTQIDRGDVPMSEPIAATGAILAKPAKAFAALQDELGLAKGDALAQIAVLPAETVLQTLDTLDGVMPTELPTDITPTRPDVAPTAPLVVMPDLAQNLTQDMGGDGQPLPAKTEVAPSQVVAQTPAPVPNAPTLAPQLAAQILPHSNAAKTGPIEVLLNPAELGHLRFEIHQKGENVQVVLSAERPETLELLRRNGDQLASEFRNAGFAGASLSFGQWGRSSDGQPPASFLANADDDFVPIVTPQTAKPPTTQDNSRNLNLRL